MSIRQPVPLTLSALYPVPSGEVIDDTMSAEFWRDLHCVTHLLGLCQSLCTQVHGHAQCLCQEVRTRTQERAQLLLGHQRTMKKTPLPAGVAAILPVQFADVSYGILCVTADPTQKNQPALAFPIAQLLAQVCSCLLYTFEQTTFIQAQCSHLEYQVNGALTKREREILSLIYRGYDQDAIADKLCISPRTVSKHRQHIYEQLGVHNEQDARLAAYHIGLFSLVDDH